MLIHTFKLIVIVAYYGGDSSSTSLENRDFTTVLWAPGKKYLRPIICLWSLQRKGLILMGKVHCCAFDFHPAIIPPWHNSICVNFTPYTVNSSLKKVWCGVSEDVIYRCLAVPIMLWLVSKSFWNTVNKYLQWINYFTNESTLINYFTKKHTSWSLYSARV